MNLSRLGLILVIACGLLGGTDAFMDWIHLMKVRTAPIVVGKILSRAPDKSSGVPIVIFTIQVESTGDIVHAHAGRYLATKVPTIVRFRYSGNPLDEVFLYEHERNPLWIFVFCWSVAILFAIILVTKLRWGGAMH